MNADCIRATPICSLMLVSFLCCTSPQQTTDPPDPGPVSSEWPALTGPYLGQTPPGMTPTRFVPAALAATSDWFHHGAPAFSRDGSEMFFVRYPTDETIPMEIQTTRLVDGRWIEPEKASFASESPENNPCFSVDGSKLFYVSSTQEDRYKLVTRSGFGWSNPVSVSVPSIPSAYRGWQLSVSRRETLIFEIRLDDDYDLYSSELVDGVYTTPVSLGDRINSDYNDFAPFIHPDEDFIAFTSQRPGGMGSSDLYISFKDSEGEWTAAVNMGSPINSSGSDAWPYLSPDGEYFFFVSGRSGDAGFNPYWVDARIIEDLRASLSP